MEDLTIVYCSSNKEKPEFEKKIQTHLLDVCNDIPIISVSQKPINLGKNIVVGDVGASGFNFFRQLQIACEEATTKFVISAEADCLYPPDYFNFIPERDDVCYRNDNIYVMAHKRKFFFKKDGSTFAQIVGREYYLDILNKLFKNAPQWNVEEKNFPKERWHKSDIFNKILTYSTNNPCLSFKTSDGMRTYTHSTRIPIYDLPYWGSTKELINKYL